MINIKETKGSKDNKDNKNIINNQFKNKNKNKYQTILKICRSKIVSMSIPMPMSMS